MKQASKFALIVFTMAVLLYPVITSAQLGEVAGQPNFQVPPGGNETIQITLINYANTTLNITSQPEYPTAMACPPTPCQATPTLVINPLSFSIPAGKTFKVNMTVYMPANDTPGVGSWQQLIEGFSVVPNSSIVGGANLGYGVAKEVSIETGQYTTSTTSSSTALTSIQIPQVLPPAQQKTALQILIPFVWLIIILFIIWYLYHLRKRIKEQQMAAAPRGGRGRTARRR